jgi:hypothetical protein
MSSTRCSTSSNVSSRSPADRRSDERRSTSNRGAQPPSSGFCTTPADGTAPGGTGPDGPRVARRFSARDTTSPTGLRREAGACATRTAVAHLGARISDTCASLRAHDPTSRRPTGSAAASRQGDATPGDSSPFQTVVSGGAIVGAVGGDVCDLGRLVPGGPGTCHPVANRSGRLTTCCGKDPTHHRTVAQGQARHDLRPQWC